MQYDYMEVSIKTDKLSLRIDGYESLGWTEDERKLSKEQTIVLRRDRHVSNKVELTRLQRNFEACIDQIQRMEKARETNAVMSAIAMGLVGCAFLAGGVFAYLEHPDNIVMMIALAIPGFVCWILPMWVKRKVLEREAKRLVPLIEAKYDEIYAIMEKGKRLFIQ